MEINIPSVPDDHDVCKSLQEDFVQTVLCHSNSHRLHSEWNLKLFLSYTCVIQQFEYSDSGSVRHKEK